MSRRLISSGSTFEARIGYSRAVVDGDWVFVSGTTGYDYATMTISDSVAEQAAQAQLAQNVAASLGATPIAAAAAAKSLPPEVVAARELKELPKINEVGVETLFGEDLISEKSLDEVILSYLAGDGEAG